jgi:hypothetical protein
MGYNPNPNPRETSIKSKGSPTPVTDLKFSTRLLIGSKVRVTATLCRQLPLMHESIVVCRVCTRSI